MQAVLVGNFDGVHRGHQALLAAARGLVGAEGRVVAFTMDPHPGAVLGRGHQPRLTPLPERLERLSEAGADEVRVLPVDAGLLALGPRQFLEWLRSEVDFGWLVAGADFRFGAGRAGGIAEARRFGEELGFRVQDVPNILVNHGKSEQFEARSSKIRELISAGDLARARTALGRPFSIRAEVVRGVGEARVLGFPTANLEVRGRCLPPEGVYLGRGREFPGGEWHPAAIHWGVRPAHSALGPSLEAVLLDASGRPLAERLVRPIGTYGWRLELEFGSLRRPITRFSDQRALVAAIEEDARAAVASVRAGQATAP